MLHVGPPCRCVNLGSMSCSTFSSSRPSFRNMRLFKESAESRDLAIREHLSEGRFVIVQVCLISEKSDQRAGLARHAKLGRSRISCVRGRGLWLAFLLFPETPSIRAAMLASFWAFCFPNNPVFSGWTLRKTAYMISFLLQSYCSTV